MHAVIFQFYCLIFESAHMLYILTSNWMLRKPNTSRNSHFQRFCAFKAKKRKICCKFLQKTGFLDFAPKRWSSVSFPKNSWLKKLCWKWLFWPAFGVPSTEMLVKIYNTHSILSKPQLVQCLKYFLDQSLKKILIIFVEQVCSEKGQIPAQNVVNIFFV